MAVVVAGLTPATIGLIGTAIGMSGSFLGIGNNIFGMVSTRGEHPLVTNANTIVRVAVGLNHDPAKNRQTAGFTKHGPWDDYTLDRSGGDEPLLVAFDENEMYIGHSHHHKKTKIPDGGHHDLEIHHEEIRETVQATWLQVISQNDGVCIAYITETWADDTKRSWMGDMGLWCDYEWSYSNLIVGDDHHKPYCTWIDNDGSHNSYAKALQIHMEDFKDLNANYSTLDMASYCTVPKMLFQDQHDYDPKMFTGSIVPATYVPYHILADRFKLWLGQTVPHVEKENPLRDSEIACPHTDAAESTACYQTRRVKEKRRAALDRQEVEHLIVTNDPKHSAVFACNSSTFRGPDVFSKVEDKLCDLQTRTVWDHPCRRDSEMFLGDRVCVGDMKPKRRWLHRFQRWERGPARQYKHVEEWGGAKSDRVERR